jgi:hypothetical protein
MIERCEILSDRGLGSGKSPVDSFDPDGNGSFLGDFVEITHE